MHFFRRQLRSFTWVAMFTAFGLALAPTASHALASRGGGFNPWAEICSAAGATGLAAATTTAAAVSVADDELLPARASTLHLDHCPLCGSAGHSAAVLPSAIAVLPLPEGAEHIPALFAHSPRPLFAWAAAQPRGPPLAS